MPASSSSCHILGNLSKEPDFRRTQTGSAVCELSVAVNRRGNNGENEVSFLDVIAWGKTAENCRQYLSKGSQVYIDGYLKQEKWQDRNTGSNRSKIRIVAEKILFLNNRMAEKEQRNENNEEENTQRYSGVDPVYAPPVDHERKPRFYGDVVVSKSTSAVEDIKKEVVEDDIPF
jgi:single stranded DNA-binding protein